MNVHQRIKTFWQKQSTQVIYQELKQIAKENPYKFPWWVLTTVSTASSFIDHPILGNKKLNELGLHETRVRLAADLARKRRIKLAKFLSADDVAQFEKNGFIYKENFLSEAEFTALKDELMHCPLPTRETLQGDTVTRRMALDYRSLPKLPHTQHLLQSAQWQHLINYVGSFKIEPMYYVQVILSHIRKARPDPQTSLHSDTFHPSMKAWLFLTDVIEDEGPFVYVPGSHVLNEKRLAWERKRVLNLHRADKMTRRGSFRIEEKDLASLDYGQPQKFAVKANTLVIGDTYGFHARGESVRASTRIELWAFARRNPFMPWVGFNPVSLPLVKSRVIPAYWWFLDHLEERGLKKNPWRKVGARLANDPPQLLEK